ISNLKSQISKLAPESQIFTATNAFAGLVPSFGVSGLPTGGTSNAEIQAENIPAFAFCGLGSPASFFCQLEMDGFNIVGRKAFPDHYYYSQADVLSVEREARDAGAKVLITTAKDAVRLDNSNFSMECFVVELEMQIYDEIGFREFICFS